MMNFKLTKNEIVQKINDFKNLKILVIGDIMLDHYINGNTERISQEAPVPIVHVSEESYILGGAGNVISNLSKLNCNSTIISRVGFDNNAGRIKRLINSELVGFNLIVYNQPTICKTRVISMGQQVIRIDKEKYEEINQHTKDRILDSDFSKYDGIIISDYGKGMINDNLLSEIRNRTNLPLFIDPCKEDKYKTKLSNSYVLPNEIEAEEVDLSKFQHKIITTGKRGILLNSEDNGIYSQQIEPNKIEQVYDTVGAGDTVTSIFTCCILSGLPIVESCYISNIAASISIKYPGTYSVSKNEIINELERQYGEGK